MSKRKFTRKIKHVTQPTSHSCVSACISMVTGVNVEKILILAERMFKRDFHGDTGMSMKEELQILNKLGADVTQKRVPELRWEEVYILTVPSLNLKGCNHRIVLDMRDFEITVLDPNKGREGRLSYPDDCELLGYSEVLRING